MYEFKTYSTGKFEVYNVRRKKIVYVGTDKIYKDTPNKVQKFKNVQDMMGKICSQISMTTFKKMSKKLCAW